MGCSGLTFFRWFCCVFVVTVNILGMIVGALLAILGFLLLYGYTVLQQLSGSYLTMANQSFKDMFGADIDLQSYFQSIATITGSAAGLLIGFGILVIIISCIGCCGACCGIAPCLIIYKICVALLLIGQLIVIIIWFADSNIMKRSARTTMDSQVEKYTGERNSNFETLTLNLVQMFIGCCGVANGSDFDKSNNWNRSYTSTSHNYTTILKYPVTCCKFNMTTITPIDKYCPINGTEATSNFRIGCYNKVFSTIDEYWRLDNIFYALAGLLGLELLLILGAILIYCAKRQEKQSNGNESYKMQPV